MNNLKVVIFNAPPRLGKDTAVEHLIKQTNTEDTFYTAHHRTFKDSLFKLCASMYGITVEDFLEGYDEEDKNSTTGWAKDTEVFNINSNKSNECDCWSSCSCGYGDRDKHYSQRSSLIHMSENIIKPVFGSDAFGKAMVASLPESGIVFVSDGGFAEELIPVIDHVGGDNVLVVRIHREGVDFAGDSRSYLETKDLGNACVQDIDNDSTLEEFLVNVESAVGVWLNK